jgi:hypothetical protein
MMTGLVPLRAASGQVQQGQANQANWYNGWSNFAKMKNRDPPLVMAYSCPIKCKLTPEVGLSFRPVLSHQKRQKPDS